MVRIGKFKLHYAWVVLFAACMLNIASRADHGSFGVFVEPLVEFFGWSRGDISVAYSVAFIVGLPAVVIMGWLGDRYGARHPHPLADHSLLTHIVSMAIVQGVSLPPSSRRASAAGSC